MALRDYYTEKYHDGSLQPSDTGEADAAIQLTLVESQQDAWALPYISMLYIQPLIEAFDDDASGFVTVSEANSFTAARPLDFRFVISPLPSLPVLNVSHDNSLPHWLAYWSTGKIEQLQAPVPYLTHL